MSSRVPLDEVVSVIGCGYVGYPLALLAAAAGYRVVAVDIDGSKVDALNAGAPLLDEDGVSDLTHEALSTGGLEGSERAVPADVFVLAVPTPTDASGAPDLRHVRDAASSIAEVLKPGSTVIVESTVPPGTTRAVVLPLLERGGLKAGADFGLAHCPERVLPGRVIDELVHGERLIGGLDDTSTAAARKFYRSFSKGELLETDLETAEFVKLIENTYRDVNIALANQIAEIARGVGIDPHEATKLANGHPRVDYLSPGIGVGGHCIPVDPWFLIDQSPHSELLRTAREINDRQPGRIAREIEDHVPRPGARVLLLGQAYKANTGDARNAPALRIGELLAERGLSVTFHDPATGVGGRLIDDVESSDVVVLLVPHASVMDQLHDPSDELAEMLAGRVLLDATTGSVEPFQRRDTDS